MGKQREGHEIFFAFLSQWVEYSFNCQTLLKYVFSPVYLTLLWSPFLS